MTKLLEIEKKITETEIIAAKIKAVNFSNYQSFDFVNGFFKLGEIYFIDNIGYTVITEKEENKISFIVIMNNGTTWQKHWQDVDKHLEIRQGVYLDLFTGKEYKDSVYVKAYEPSYFKSVGENDLVIKGSIIKNDER